jgi:hypothetical protein
MAEACRYARGVRAAAIALAYHEKSRPPGEMFYRTGEFVDAMADLKDLLAILRRVGF